MPDNDDQLTRLGQQVLDAIIATYNPTANPSLALAFHPGQAVADDIVQSGVTNELRLSGWLADQYDYPLWLKLAGGTALVTSTLGGVTAKSAYVTMARSCQPGVGADDPAFPRLAQLINETRASIGEQPDALPFGCEPTDFAETDCPAWQVFDTEVSAHSSETTAQPGPAGRVLVDPDLWKIRALPAEVLDDLPRRRRARRLSQEFSDTGVEGWQSARFRLAAVAATTATAEPAVGSLASMTVRSAVTNLAVTQLSAAPAADTPVHAVGASLVAQSAHVNLADLVAQPAVSTATTVDSLLHVHFEYLVLTITRRIAGTPWWRPEFVEEPAWYVPGMKRGALVPASEDPAYAPCLPQSLLLVRNVSLTGVWSDEARATMSGAVHYVGPFLMTPPEQTLVSTTDTEHRQQTTATGLGVQVIGELCRRLPALPPMDDPALSGA